VLSPELELLDGSLDQQTLRLLVYSIHVSIGFQTLEILLDRIIGQFPGTVWYYGNVYDPADGVTPLDWWQEFLAPV
jgi:cytochrome b561